MAMRVKDVRDVPFTVGSEGSAEPLFRAIDSYLTFRADALAETDAAIESDPECPMAWVLRGYLLMFARTAALVPDARAALARAKALETIATRRECQHMDALAAWIEGRSHRAQVIWSDILAETRVDLLALRVQHFNAIFLGQPDLTGRYAARTIATWDKDVPGAGFAWSTACMGLEEVGDYGEAERIGRAATDLEPDDLWAVHSVAHVMEAEGRLGDGLDWMQRPARFWEGRGPMKHHLLWHEALFIYQGGAYDAVLDFYDARIEPDEKNSYMEIANASSLLLRLEAAGVRCGERWQRLAERARQHIDSRGLTFADIHMLLTYGMAGDRDGLAHLDRSISAYAGHTTTNDAEASAKIALPVARAMGARHAGDFVQATRILNEARPDFIRMGGSHAQRDALDILLIDCAARSDDTSTARRLMNDYLERRPGSVPMQERLAALEAA